MNKEEIILKLAEMLLGGQQEKRDLLADFIGKKVLIRDHMAGVFVTTLTAVDGKMWTGAEGRKIHYWEGAGAVEGISAHGIDNKKSRVTAPVPVCNGRELVQLLPLTEDVYKLIMGAPVWNP